MRRKPTIKVGLVSDAGHGLRQLHAQSRNFQYGAILLLTSPTLNAAWDRVLGQFAKRYAGAPCAQGPETATQIERMQGLYPDWEFCIHDVVLSASLAPLAINRDPLAGALEHLQAVLSWHTRGVFTDAEFTNRAYVELIGPDGMVRSDDIRLGFYWHDSHTFYPAHRHNAVELYHVLSGTGLWQYQGRAWTPRPAGSFILHESRQDHATRTEAEPILTLWSWTGDISFDSYSMDTAGALLS